MNAALIVAGGKGARFGSSQPKQFEPLNGLPLLMHTLISFANSSSQPLLFLAIPGEEVETWQILCQQHKFQVAHQMCVGGNTRFESVRNGLCYMNDHNDGIATNTLVGIHDGARPLISQELIDRIYAEASIYGSAVPCITPSESLRQLQNGHSLSVDRSSYRLAQTPQCFYFEQIFKAYKEAPHANFTDDAAVAEHAGIPIHLIEGERKNIKVTFAEDLAIARAYLQTRQSGSTSSVI